MPRTFTIPVGRTVRLAISDHIGGCLLQTIFDGLGPSGEDVTVTVPVGATRIVALRAPRAGAYSFHCGSNTYSGTIVGR